MNHPHESQAAAMARTGELADGEQLRECINSGQVSAAQVVAHAETGEVTTGWPAGTLQDDSKQLSKALSRDPNARALARNAAIAIERFEPEHDSEGNYMAFYLDGDYVRHSDHVAALSAERAEVARLREAAEAVFSNEEHAFSGGMRNYQKGSQTWQVYEDLRIALTAPGEKHE